jgi:GNAT superfamily N-acetyltransferase
MIHRDFQRRGFGSEIAKGFLRWAESRGWPEVRIGVLEGNEKVLAFWHSLGFEPYTIKEKRMPSGLKSVVCMRYPISSPKT